MIRDPASKIMTYEQAIAFRQQLHDRGGKLVVTNGCFDVLHRGHVEYLSKSRLEGDALLVAVNGDASLRAVKGPTRPIVCEEDRAYLIASLECVDAVVVFPNQKPLDLFEQVPPDIYVKGGDYTEETTDREEYVVLKAVGAQFVFIPFVAGRSTTNVIDRIKQILEEESAS